MGVWIPIRRCRRGVRRWGWNIVAQGYPMFALNKISTDPLGSSAGLRIKELEQQQQSLLKSVIGGFNQLLDLRDLGTGVHSTRLAEWAVRVARKLGIPEGDLYQLEVAALLHDI